MGIKKIGSGIWAWAPHKTIWTFIKDGFKVPEKQSARQIRTQSIERIKNFRQGLKQDRDPWADNAPDMTDFQQVLNHWGITWDDLSFTWKMKAAKAGLFAVMALWGLIYLFIGGKWGIAGVPAMAAGTVVAVCEGWRAQVLYRRKFTFFKDWFLWGLFDAFGKETPIARAKRLEAEREGN